MDDDLDLDALLESLVAGGPVDLDRARTQATSREARARLEALGEVARLSDFHHSLQAESGAAQPRPPIERWGNLLVLERTAAGGSGEVFRAWEPVLQREVALKLLGRRESGGPKAAEWLAEARGLARVRHPHVVTIYGAGEHDGQVGLWMEFLHGPTLEQEIERRGPLPADEVARLGIQIGRALEAVHASGTVHRDVKPANIVLEPGPRAVLTDFGLGQSAREPGPVRPFSGTPLFMSPQRLSGALARPADDLYALGVSLRWALTGRPPYDAGTLETLRAEAGRGPAVALARERPDAAPPLVAAIERAMAPEPASRFASAAELVAALEAAEALVGAHARGARRAGSRRVVLATAALALAAVAVWLAIGRRPGPAAKAPAAAPTVPPAYDVSAQFFRRGRGGDVRLESGDRVMPGDQVSLEFRASRPAWVYVLDADDRGETYLLFPQPVFEVRNPLPAESTVVLPGPRHGREIAWTVTSRGGHEHLLVVADVAPVPELESELSRLPAPTEDAPVRYQPLGAATLTRLRGMGGFSEVRSSAPAGGPDPRFERVRALAGREHEVHGTWVRQVVLSNPVR